MSATFLILIGILGFTIVFYFITQRNNTPQARQRPPQQPAVPVTGMPPYPYPYLPPQFEPEEEEQRSYGMILWLTAFLAVIAAVIFLGYQLNPEEAAAPAIRSYSEVTSSGQSDKQFDYDAPKQGHHYDPGETSRAVDEYRVPLPTPRTNRNRTVDTQASLGNDNTDSTPELPSAGQEEFNYQEGYGVQLLATENGWWEDAQALRLQEKYPELRLLVGTGYNRKGVKVNKFLIGTFPTKDEADEFARRIGSEFSGAFAVRLSSLEEAGRYWPVP